MAVAVPLDVCRRTPAPSQMMLNFADMVDKLRMICLWLWPHLGQADRRHS